MQRPCSTGARVTALAIVIASTVGEPAAASGRRHGLTGQRITVGRTCAPRWRAPNPGRARFVVRNQSGRRATVYFFTSITNHVVGRIGDLSAHSSAPLVVTAKPGRTYSWGCDLRGMPQHVSEAEKVPRHPVKGGTGRYVPPVDAEQARQPLRLYRVYVKKRLAALQPLLQTLRDAIGAADLDAAKRAWLAARRTYLTIGQDNDAYGAFGTLGAKIDGTATGLKAGTADRRFTGFHEVELDLWGTGDLVAAATDAAHLSAAVTTLSDRRLPSMLPANKAGESDWILRSHEILEDAIRDTLSGNDDYGSGTSLSSVTADVRATRQILVLLTPLIVPRSPHLLNHANNRLHRLVVLARATRQNGAWVPMSALSRTQRESINAAAGAAVETLAPVPDLLRIGNT